MVLDNDLVIVPKKVWEVRIPGFVPFVKQPVKSIIFGFPQTFYAKGGKPQLGPMPDSNKCINEIRFMQVKDCNKYPDIKYNFVIGPDGRVYEGRGWQYVPSLPRKLAFLNFQSYYICFIGDFAVAQPLKLCYMLRDKLIRLGVEKGYIHEKHLLYIMRHNVVSEWDDFDFTTNKPLKHY